MPPSTGDVGGRRGARAVSRDGEATVEKTRVTVVPSRMGGTSGLSVVRTGPLLRPLGSPEDGSRVPDPLYLPGVVVTPRRTLGHPFKNLPLQGCPDTLIEGPV